MIPLPLLFSSSSLVINGHNKISVMLRREIIIEYSWVKLDLTYLFKVQYRKKVKQASTHGERQDEAIRTREKAMEIKGEGLQGTQGKQAWQ